MSSNKTGKDLEKEISDLGYDNLEDKVQPTLIPEDESWESILVRFRGKLAVWTAKHKRDCKCHGCRGWYALERVIMGEDDDDYNGE